MFTREQLWVLAVTLLVQVRTAYIQTKASASFVLKPPLRIDSVDGGWKITQRLWPCSDWQLFFSWALFCASLPFSLSLLALPLPPLSLMPCSPWGWGCHGLIHTKAAAFHKDKAFTGPCTVELKLYLLAFSCWKLQKLTARTSLCTCTHQLTHTQTT